ncbi:MAG: hypothetical protein K6T85_01730 [Gorillibacterium sp.]|nr:hypothetical protein [Gorillibacterium sp.]
MTLAEMRQLLQSFLDEDGIRRPDSVLNESINDGYVLVSMLTQAHEVTRTLRLPPGRAFYYLPSDFFLPVSVYIQNNIRLQPTRIGELDLLYDNWFLSGTTGTPVYYFTVGALTNRPQLWLYPKPQDVTMLTITYAAIPKRMNSDGDIPRIPAEYHLTLVWWAFAWELLKERGFEMLEKTVRQFNLFVESVMKLRDYIYNRTPDRDVQTVPWDLTSFEKKLHKLKGGSLWSPKEQSQSLPSQPL